MDCRSKTCVLPTEKAFGYAHLPRVASSGQATESPGYSGPPVLGHSPPLRQRPLSGPGLIFHINETTGSLASLTQGVLSSLVALRIPGVLLREPQSFGFYFPVDTTRLFPFLAAMNCAAIHILAQGGRILSLSTWAWGCSLTGQEFSLTRNFQPYLKLPSCFPRRWCPPMLSAGSVGGLGVGEGLEEVGPCSHSQGPDTALQQCVLACRSRVLCSMPLNDTFPLWL